MTYVLASESKRRRATLSLPSLEAGTRDGADRRASCERPEPKLSTCPSSGKGGATVRCHFYNATQCERKLCKAPRWSSPSLMFGSPGTQAQLRVRHRPTT